MSFFLRVAVVLLVWLCSLPSFGQQNWPNSLLWKISGNNLPKPSYLYGTLHLQDKRLFNFGDSLYQALERVEGLALEVDFKEYLDSLFMKGVQRAEDRFLEEQKVKIDKRKLDKSSDSLLKKFGVNKDRVTKKDLKKIRDYRMNRFLQRGEMPTIVDGYLFGLALRQGKWVGGIEDVMDQLNLFDELGAELTPENVLAPEANMRKGIELMIQMYLQQDLGGIDNFINGYERETKDVLLTQRNIKMARRMDSLSAIRTMFFAVGAAHLPGDSGVITLLRHKGFTVEPVYSSQKIAADVYAKKLQQIPWYKVEGDQKLYSVEMPGNPSQFNEFGQALQMKMFFDITKMAFYMTGQTIGKFSSSKEFDQAFKAMAERMGASSKQLVSKNVSRKSFQGREAVFENEGVIFRLQLLQKANTLYIVATGSINKVQVNSADADRFFSSFTAYDIVSENKDWVKFKVPEKAFSIMLPGQPKKNTAIDKQAEGSSWSFHSYDFIDNAKGLYYLIQVRDLREGYYLNGDSAYFNAYAADTKTRMDTILRSEISSYKGFPAFYYDAVYNKNVTYKTFHVARGSRIYVLMVGGTGDGSWPEAEALFHSLELEDYTAADWNIQQAEGFSTFAPAPIFKKIDSTGNENRSQFISYNATDAVSYQILKEPLSPFYWVKDDSSFFAERINAYKEDGDSILKTEITQNGQLKAADLLVRKAGNHNLEKVRVLLNGDTLYTLLAFIPEQYINGGKHDRFFKDFKVDKELQTTIYNNKGDQLLIALQTKDSSEFAKATSAFNSISFTKQDLPFLHQVLLYQYQDSGEYNNIRSKALSYLDNLGDNSTIDFVVKNYSVLPGEKEPLKYDLLQALAGIHTSQSFIALKSLLLDHIPSTGNASSLKYKLDDSLELTKQLYPEILKLSSDSLFAEVLVSISNRLFDSNLLNIAAIVPYKNNFLHQANKYVTLLKNDPEQWWKYRDWIPFLQKLNDKESNAVLQKFVKLPETGLKSKAVIALLKNEQPVPAAELLKIAADKEYRADFYRELNGLKKANLFPVQYAKQQSLAESDLYAIVSDEYEVGAVLFLGEKTASYQGKKKKFFLFKITLQFEEGEKESYLGIAGPYDLNTKELIPYSDAGGIYWQEPFNQSKTGKQFGSYLAGLQSPEE